MEDKAGLMTYRQNLFDRQNLTWTDASNDTRVCAKSIGRLYLGPLSVSNSTDFVRFPPLLVLMKLYRWACRQRVSLDNAFSRDQAICPQCCVWGVRNIRKWNERKRERQQRGHHQHSNIMSAYNYPSDFHAIRLLLASGERGRSISRPRWW